MRYIITLTLAISFCCAQPISVSAGFKLGAPLNDPSAAKTLGTSYVQGRWTGGPTVELHLPHRFSLEFDALYRNYQRNTTSSFQLAPNVNSYLASTANKTNAWDFPILLKYRFQVGSLHPFISGGYGFTHESSHGSYKFSCTGPIGSCRPADYPSELGAGTSRSSHNERGPVAGLGLDFRRGPITITPEFRFSRATYGAYPQDNRFTALVGFSFGKRFR